MPSWTKDQSLAINERGGKIIVSAAAGSGKTAVLSQRVINFVLDGGYINRLLIVTFTKAAATEMKERIRNKINDAFLDDPTNEHLKKQLELVDSARITTMDSFYGNVVKENFEKLGIDKNFEILSNEEETIIKEKILNSVIEDSFDTIEDFELLPEFFGGYGVDNLKKVIFKISSFLDTLPFKEEFISKSLSNYNDDNTFYKDILFTQIKDKMSSFSNLYESIIEEMYSASSDFDKMLDTLRKEKNYMDYFLEVNTFDELSSLIRRVEFDTLRTPKGHKDDPVMVKFKIIRDEFKSEIKKNLNEISFITDDIYLEEKRTAKKIMTILFKVVDVYERKLLDYKLDKNSYTFSDIAHFVIELLVKDGKKTFIASNIEKQFDEILIDEYQDTNNLQNVIFNAISKNNSNLFIVGDVKQSIYRFRSACPEIFNKDKDEASKDSFPKLITLSKNFRSRGEVLDFCNFIFENTMTKYYGEVNYDENERLYLGASFVETDDLDTEVHIIDGMEKNESLEEDISKVEKEAIYVAEKIKSLIDNKYQVYDNKKGIKRDIKPSDIVILLRSLKNASYFSKALSKRNISAYLENSPEYFDNYEIKLVINLLKVIDNPFDDVSLMSLLHSSLVNISLDDIADLRSKNKYVSLYESLLNKNEDINGILTKIEDLRSYAQNNMLHELISEIYKIFDVVPVISAMENGYARQKNLMQMINHANLFDGKNLSLHEFIDYLENVLLSKGSLEGVNPLSDSDNVLITTIHKSKGLEYPVVFVSETGKSFNFMDLRNDVMINEDFGFCFNMKDIDHKLKYESVWMMAFKEYEKNKMLSEELRILYVALTRAKEKIIITGYVNNLERLVTKVSSKIGDENVISSLYLKSVKSYIDIIIACLLRHPSCKNLRDLSMVDAKTFMNPSLIKTIISSAANINESEFNEKTFITKKDFDKEWFDKISSNEKEETSSLPVYLSVSEIKKDKTYEKMPNFMSDGVNHANIGTLYHKIFECLPVQKYNVKLLEEELSNMVLNNIITKEEKELVSLEKVFAYLTSKIYDELLVSDKVYREKEFSFFVPSSYYDKTLKSGKILSSGVVDLIFVNKDLYTIVDYKTDKVDTLEELKDRYKVQLDLYEIALRDIMGAKNIRKYIYSIKLNGFIEV